MTSKLALIALLLVAGCNSGSRDPAGAGGTGGTGGAGGSGGSGNPSACGVNLNGSCRHNLGVECREVAGLTAAQVSAITAVCEEDNIGTWTDGSPCARTGAVGGCQTIRETVCEVFWTYEGTTADAMSQCVDDDGTWVAP